MRSTQKRAQSPVKVVTPPDGVVDFLLLLCRSWRLVHSVVIEGNDLLCSIGDENPALVEPAEVLHEESLQQDMSAENTECSRRN